MKVDNDFTKQRYVMSTCETYELDSFTEIGIEHPDKSMYTVNDVIDIYEAVQIGDKFLIRTNHG